MKDVLLFATIIAPIVLALVQMVKQVVIMNVNIIPPIALVIGLLVGYLAEPFTDLGLALRLWSGALAGLSATGLFELVKQRKGDDV